jgi:prephenate dehydrogenase
MNESDFIKNISIIGVGQIGGSLALSLRKYFKNSIITAWDTNKELLQKAYMAHKKATSLNEAVSYADLIWIATPIDSILKLIPQIASLNPKALICDVGSTKQIIVKTVNSLKSNFRYVSTHPLAGTEKYGPDSWNASLFENKIFFITKTNKSSKNDLLLVNQLIISIKANPVEISASKHDKILAYTSHLPYLISVAINNIFENLNIENKNIFQGPAYQSVSRLSKCLPSVMTPIIKTNYSNIKKATKNFISELQKQILMY